MPTSSSSSSPLLPSRFITSILFSFLVTHTSTSSASPLFNSDGGSGVHGPGGHFSGNDSGNSSSRTTSSTSSDHNLSKGAIVGIVIGTVLGLVIVSLVIYVYPNFNQCIAKRIRFRTLLARSKVEMDIGGGRNVDWKEKTEQEEIDVVVSVTSEEWDCATEVLHEEDGEILKSDSGYERRFSDRTMSNHDAVSLSTCLRIVSPSPSPSHSRSCSAYTSRFTEAGDGDGVFSVHDGDREEAVIQDNGEPASVMLGERRKAWWKMF